jgi:hypothetical protein
MAWAAERSYLYVDADYLKTNPFVMDRTEEISNMML